MSEEAKVGDGERGPQTVDRNAGTDYVGGIWKRVVDYFVFARHPFFARDAAVDPAMEYFACSPAMR